MKMESPLRGWIRAPRSEDEPNAAARDVRQSFCRLQRIGTKPEEPKNNLISVPASASQCTLRYDFVAAVIAPEYSIAGRAPSWRRAKEQQGLERFRMQVKGPDHFSISQKAVKAVTPKATISPPALMDSAG
jgi:hypothetical protein